MFGYVRVSKGELKVKEYELYRGAYCGLCRSMGKCTGQCSRMALSYDLTFLVALRLALTDTPVEFRHRRCLVHPLTKRSVMERNEVLDYCSYAAAILSYHKVKDDLADEKGFKWLRAVLMLPITASWRRRALKSGLSELDGKVAEQLRRLAELEKSGPASVDAPARVFGELLSDMVSFGLEGSRKRIGAELGTHVGRWIYTVDALDDAAEDRKKGRYNPFVLLYGGRLPEGEELSLIADGLKAELVGAEAAMDLLETDKTAVKNIIENILYLGLPETVERIICVISEGDNGKERKSKR